MLEDPPPQAVPDFTAGRLKYADPRSLPSFPSHGLSPNGAAASAAASLGWASQKPIEPWKPDESSSAFAAAVLAKDYKMTPAWEPTSNSDGAKAALLAVGSADAALRRANSARAPKNVHDGWGNSAATQAFHASGPASPRQVNLSHGSSAANQAFAVNRTLSTRKGNVSDAAEDGKSLAAAKGAMSARPRATSSPSQPPLSKDSQPAASSALNGATMAHRASMKARAPAKDVGAVPVTTMTRNMFTSHPMVQPEVDEQQRNQELHQSAVEMARKMYTLQQKNINRSKDDASESIRPASSTPFISLQDAAYKQAQERLSKLHDDHQKSREYQEYYGSAQSPKRRFSMTAKFRRRASSDGDMDDQEQSQRIRQQMSMFSSKLSQVDSSKRDKDREALMAAAQRNVKARLQGMDEKVYMETGKVNPNKIAEWETRAQQEAQVRHETRAVNKGKVDLGGGKFMDPEEVNAIASKRVQPVLDDINEKAEVERERLAILKLEEEARQAEQEKQKARDREIKEIKRKTKGTLPPPCTSFVAMTNQVAEEDKQEERAKKRQSKQEEKEKKDEEKAAKAEQKRLAKEEKRKSRRDTFGSGHHTDRSEDEEGGRDDVTPNVQSVDETHPDLAVDTAVEATATDQPKTADESTSPTSKMKGWIKNRFSRRKSTGDQNEKKKAFLGGAALRQEGNESSTSLENRPSSMRDVALAGRDNDEPATDSRGVSPISSNSSASTERFDEAPMVLPRPLGDPAVRTSSSPTRDSRFRELMDR
ncbi:hypothetical protein S40285_08801 [Stachybotrys chlorohalonatus IBT 40285]|uniref:Eisosome protein 1 n=1 Tax=Stachybotrys chlorohalonatus (strain IBT 40285) TaxID=1283841 RepID=A0A084QC50_STAC4|nr:hypothetical protein S40285_08801 [Stachybotrys chlorohalonata IBT 40285]